VKTLTEHDLRAAFHWGATDAERDYRDRENNPRFSVVKGRLVKQGEFPMSDQAKVIDNRGNPIGEHKITVAREYAKGYHAHMRIRRLF
jgi:hypothetical protein